MNYFTYLLLLVISQVNSHVVTVNLTKLENQNPAENETRQNLTEIKELRDKVSSTAKTVMAEDKRVYLEDVLYSLKNQDWDGDEEACLNDTLSLLHSLQNFSLWAVWEWDSISSEPNGLLFGNKYQLGNFDECLGAPWSSSHPELKPQYCLTNIKLERNNKTVKKKLVEPFDPYQSALEFLQYHPEHTRPLNELTWGVCVPASCKPRSVKRLMTTMLARSHLGTSGLIPVIEVDDKCQKGEGQPQYDGGYYAFIGVMSTLLVVAISCTFMNSKNKAKGNNCTSSEIINAFCIKENAKDLLKMKKEGIEFLYGIRFMTICLIVMDHQLGITNGGPISNGRNVDQDTMSTAALFLLHDDLFVDTFFLLSGMLTVTNLMAFKRFPNPIFIILKRYVRLVVAFAVVVFFMATMMPYAGSGPLWPLIETESGPCQRNWWLSLLMLNNYVHSDDICLVVSWYIPCDFHFFIVMVMIYWIYTNYRTPAFILTAIIGVASIIIPGVINYMNGLPAVQLFTYEFVVNPRASHQFQLTYIKSHTRFGAYLVGFITGYIFRKCKASGQIQRISKQWSIIGALAGIAIMLGVMVTGTLFLRRSYYPLEGAVYAGVDRPIWAIGLAMLILCCALGCVPLISGFLSWYPWVPLSRLSYGLYLTHSLFIIRNTFVARSPQLNDYVLHATQMFGVIFWGCVAALAIWLFVEAPANNLVALLLRPKPRKSDPVNKDSSTSTKTLDISSISGSNGHLNSNLAKHNVQYSSKV